MNEHHGHEVIEMMENSGKVYTANSLQEDIIAKFGKEARFYTCSANGLDAEKIIEFLEAKGKFIEKEGGFVFNSLMKCSH